MNKPIYKKGLDINKVAHTLKNSDVPKLAKFFNPDINQKCITGYLTVDGRDIPDLLYALGYDVKWQDENCWVVVIPEHFRTKEVRIKQKVLW